MRVPTAHGGRGLAINPHIASVMPTRQPASFNATFPRIAGSRAACLQLGGATREKALFFMSGPGPASVALGPDPGDPVNDGYAPEPEEVMGVLREYHAEMGKLILEHEGTIERFTGDGMMIFFNDPTPVPNPAERALRMAMAMRDRVAEMIAKWRKRGYHLDFGVGIAQGYATIGAIGFEGRCDYGAIGTVTNLAARLYGEAKPAQILISQRLLGTVEELVEAEPVGELSLKGFSRPVTTDNVLRLKG